MNKQFKEELKNLINRYNVENVCDMPDYLLAEMIVNFIEAVGEPIKKNLELAWLRFYLSSRRM